jgi:hypothetical protein
MGLDFVHLDRYGKADPSNPESFTARKGSPRRITGFDYSQDIEQIVRGGVSVVVAPDPDRIEAHYQPEQGRIRFTARGDSLVDIDLHPLLDSLRKADSKGPHNNIPPERMYREAESEGYRVAILVHYLSAEAGKAAIESLTGTIYVRVREDSGSQVTRER